MNTRLLKTETVGKKLNNRLICPALLRRRLYLYLQSAAPLAHYAIFLCTRLHFYGNYDSLGSLFEFYHWQFYQDSKTPHKPLPRALSHPAHPRVPPCSGRAFGLGGLSPKLARLFV